jgi:hypothetical protein
MTYSKKATCRFTVSSWKEDVYADIDERGTTTEAGTYYPERGLSHAAVTYDYAGDIEGTSTLAYLIAYRPDGAPVVGFERFEGSIDGHEGSCVFEHRGAHDATSVTAHVTVVPGLGTGALENLRGEADVAIAGHADGGYELVLAYDLA